MTKYVNSITLHAARVSETIEWLWRVIHVTWYVTSVIRGLEPWSGYHTLVLDFFCSAPSDKILNPGLGTALLLH